jgi:hypothetical protein
MTETTTTQAGLIVELVDAREGDRKVLIISDRTLEEIYGTKFDVEPYLIEAPVLEVDEAIALAGKILRLVAPERGWSWRELRPEGREIYYEGDEPEKFVEEIKAEFGFDPSAYEFWGEWCEGDDDCPGFHSYPFHCPPGILDAVYGSSRWRLGS